MSDRDQVDLTDGYDVMPSDDEPTNDLLADDLLADDLLASDLLADDSQVEDPPVDDPPAEPPAEPSVDEWVDPMEESYESSAEPSGLSHRAGVPAKQPLPPPQRKRSASPAALGLLLFVATLVAGLGLSYGVLMVVGGSPQQLLNFDGLMQLDRILAFDLYPTNLFWMMAVGAALIAFLVGAAVARAIRGANGRAEHAEQMIDRITALDIEDGQGWQADELGTDPRVSAFAANTLGAYRLLQNKTARYIGQEGELHRLEKALMDGTRVDLADGYENPAVGSLADEVLRVFDDWVTAVQNSKKSDQKVSSSGSELIGVVMDACAWNVATLDQINAQGASLERLGLKIGKLAESNGDSSADSDEDVYAEAVAGIEEDLEALAEAIESLPDADAASQIVDLVDQASKLTFQIAMETARLGNKGQKLLPMTQDLEELITEARDLTGGRKRKSGRGSKFGRLFKRARKRLAVLGTGDESQSGATDIADALTGEIGPLTKKISETAQSIAHKFNLQTDRLIQLGTGVGELTGEEFDSSEIESGDPMNPPTGELAVDAFDPFHAGGKQTDPEQAGLVSDPFASAPNSPLDDPSSADEATSDSASTSSTEMSPALAGFSLDAPVEEKRESVVEPVEAAEPAEAAEPVEAAEPAEAVESVEAAEPAEAAKSDEIAADPAEPSAAAAEVATDDTAPSQSDTVDLSAEDDQVYDLAELGAVPLDEGADPAPAEDDRIYELSELGAVAMN